MQCLIRLRVFLLCCLLVISANVMLIMSGVVDAGTRQGGAVVMPGCDAPGAATGNALPAAGMACPDAVYGVCAEKR